MTPGPELVAEATACHGIASVDLSEPSRHFADVMGVRFHYVVWAGSGTPTLFLHGG